MIPNRSKENNIKMFREMIALYNRTLKAEDHLVTNEYFPVDKILKPVFPQSTEKTCKIIVDNQKSFEMARDYALAGKKVCVLNFASATNPGGGVETGANAQEEDLCRCSTLYPHLVKQAVSEYYKVHRAAHNTLYDDACIYTSHVIVARDDRSELLLSPSDYYTVDVITCAAPNLRRTKIPNNKLYDLHKSRAKRILDVAAYEGADVVILGAFGCGAFLNDPEVVAKAYRDVIKAYQHIFDVIGFAVYDTGIGRNKYNIFYDILK